MLATVRYTRGDDAATIDLNDRVTLRTTGFGGYGQMEPDHTTVPLALADGSLWNAERQPHRMLTIFCRIEAEGYEDRLALERRLAHALSPRQGIGTLVIALQDGTVRAIDAVYQSGANFGTEGVVGVSVRNLALVFLCPNPFFRSVGERHIEFLAPGSTPAAGQGAVNAEFSLPYTAIGAAPTQPRIVISGPAQDPYVRITDPDGTVRTAGVMVTMVADETLTFDFTPGKKSIIYHTSVGTDVDLRGSVTQVDGANPDFWVIQPGTSTISVVDQAASPTATADLYYYERYEVL